MLEFHDDAIILSGVTGTKLKSDIIGKYYWQWWKITSRGEWRSYSNPNTIMEMNAGSGENFISETGETVLGSAGHALELKDQGPNTSHLKVIIVEESKDCTDRLENVIKKRWPSIKSFLKNISSEVTGGVYIFNNAKKAFDIIDSLELGNSLFFFDDLRYTPWSELEFVAEKRIVEYYKTGTEFIVFLFTSDWFTGRKPMVPLPTINHEHQWTQEERSTVNDVDRLFGNMIWRSSLLNCNDMPQKIQTLVNLYRDRLHKWFRYVLPMPFTPKTGQTYHIFMCSNFEIGVRLTRAFYTTQARNLPYSPDNQASYDRFIKVHPEMRKDGSSRSDKWKILWKVITQHEEGLCDVACSDLMQEQPDYDLRERALEWLMSEGYIKQIPNLTDAWDNIPEIYRLNWDIVRTNLDVNPPPSLVPLERVLTDDEEAEYEKTRKLQRNKSNKKHEKHSTTLEDFFK